MFTLSAYFDHSNTVHVGPDACPAAHAMGAALTLSDARVAVANGATPCSECAGVLQPCCSACTF